MVLGEVNDRGTRSKSGNGTNRAHADEEGKKVKQNNKRGKIAK